MTYLWYFYQWNFGQQSMKFYIAAKPDLFDFLEAIANNLGFKTLIDNFLFSIVMISNCWNKDHENIIDIEKSKVP